MSGGKKQRLVSGVLFGVVGIGAFATAALVNVASAGPTTVVELFQSQGCSSCPPANENILTLIDRPDLIVLSFGVTYWDRLGWKDTFASHENTQRQYDYANGGLNRRNVATPQVVINGHVDIVGANRDELNRAISSTKPLSTGPALTLAGSQLAISAASAPASSADVWLVRYDPRIVQVPIRAGENGGRTLPHRNVVRELIRLGGWTGTAATFELPAAADPAYRTAILVQGASGGPIITALKS